MNKDHLMEKAHRIIEQTKHLVVIVEGINDKKIVEKLGYSKILILNKPIFSIVEEIIAMNCKEILILTDLDRKGEELYKRLRHDLGLHGVVLNNKLRDILRKLGYTHIEGLDSFILALDKY